MPVRYLPVWEQQRAEGLILCWTSHVFLYCPVGEKLTDFLLNHLQWMPFLVTEDKPPGPIDGGFLGAMGIVLEPYCIAHLVEQLSGMWCHANLWESEFAQGAEL